MKLSFSTIGCPNFSWQEITAMAKDCGFNGIEIRGMGQESFSAITNAMSAESIAQTKAELTKKRLEIACVSSASPLKYADRKQANIQEITAQIDMASLLNAPYVRILGDECAMVDGEVDDSVVLSALKELAQYAESKGVMLLVETNGVYANTARLAKLLQAVASDSVGALWDIHHPYRYMGESAGKTVENLGAYIKHVHIKDSVIENGATVYKIVGEGDIPVDSFIMALNSINYEGYISLEWLKKYAPYLGEAGIVFPNFASYMSVHTGNKIATRKLMDNNHKTGKYVWEKNKLIDYTFPQVLDRMIEEFPDQECFHYTTLDYTRTYKEFGDDVDKFAKALIGLGVKAGDHVAIWATNLPQWFITFWATTKIGAVLVTVNTAYKIHEAEYLLRQSDTHTVVMIDGYKDSDYVGIVKEICPELQSHKAGTPLHAKRLPFLRNVITIESKQNGCLTWEEAQEYGNSVDIHEVYRREASISKDEVCNMQYTSGTTGFPKGVMLTHYNVVNNGKAIGDCMDLSTADRMMIQVPMFHCFGMVLAMTSCMTHGATMCPIPAFSPSKGLDCINKAKITAFHGVPTMFIAMLGHKNFDSTDFSYMRTGIMAGSPCPVKVMEEVVAKMNMSEICITYGQTEASPGCTMSHTTDSIETRVSTVGSAMFGVECKIVDPETYEDLPDNTDGEFVARGYNIMKGYYKMPEATASAIDKDGWLHTGDLARRDENGNYKITGRIKDMIIRGGENIYPKEIEDFIYTHEKVSDVQVIGVPDKQYGEEIMACVILKPDITSSEAEIKEYCMSHMAKHKTPRYVAFVDSFPMNAAGKILKYKMRENAIAELSLQDANSIETA